MGIEDRLFEDGASQESLTSQSGWAIRLHSDYMHEIPYDEFQGICEFVEGVAASFHNIGSAGIIKADYVSKPGECPHINLRFGELATLREVVSISRAVALAGDLRCVPEVFLYSPENSQEAPVKYNKFSYPNDKFISSLDPSEDNDL